MSPLAPWSGHTQQISKCVCEAGLELSSLAGSSAFSKWAGAPLAAFIGDGVEPQQAGVSPERGAQRCVGTCLGTSLMTLALSVPIWEMGTLTSTLLG